KAQKAADIGIVGVAPELPVFVGRQFLGVEPDRALRALAHFGTGGGRNQRRRQAEQSPSLRAPREFDTGDDIAPLVGSADLHFAAEAARQLYEVVGLQDRIIEFEKAQGLITPQPQSNAVLG